MNPITATTLKTDFVTWYWQNHAIPLLALLEYPFKEAHTIVRETYEQEELQPEAAVGFGFDQLIVVLLSLSVSNSWSERALDWLGQAFPVSSTIVQAMGTLIAGKRVAQHVQHRALLTLVRPWRTVNAKHDG